MVSESKFGVTPLYRRRLILWAGRAGAAVVIAAVLQSSPFVEAATRSQQPLGLESEQGTQNSLILRIQRLLSAQGHYHGGADGRISEDLRSAIRRYQRLTGRDVDGKVSEPLAQHLATQNRVGDMLNRLEKTRSETKEAARRALLRGERTRALIDRAREDEVADPTRDASSCFEDPTEFCLLEEAVESAKAVGKAELRDWAFGEILVAQAKAGLIDEAISTVRRIGDARLIIVALRDIARAQVRSGRVDGAQQAAAIIPDPFKRLEALAAVADLQVRRKDSEGAAKTAAAIVEEARTLKTSLQRVTLLAQMAIVLSKMGDENGASLLIQEAQRIAQSSDMGAAARRTEKAAALRHVAAAYSEMGQVSRALSVINSMRGDYDKTAVLMDVAAAQSSAGELDAAIKTANQIGSPRYRAVALGRIAVSQARGGKAGSATETVNRALDETSTIKMPYARSYAIGQLALSLIEIGLHSNDDALQRAIIMSEKIENPRLQAYALWVASATQAKKGLQSEAQDTVALAEKATKKIIGALSRVWLFGDLGSEYSGQGNKADAAEAFGRGLKIAQAIRNSWARARALAKLATTLNDLQ